MPPQSGLCIFHAVGINEREAMILKESGERYMSYGKIWREEREERNVVSIILKN